MSRREFSAKIRADAFARAKGCCEHPDCGKKLHPGDIFYDHVIADGLGGPPTLDNCQVLCKSHHDPKTRLEDVPAIAKAKRRHAKHFGARAPSRWWRPTQRAGGET